MNLTQLVILPFAVAAGITFLVTPLVIKLANKIGIIDNPKTNKHEKVIHTYPVPRGGGLALYLGILAASIIFLPLDWHLSAILIGGLILVFLGLIDDKYNISPYKRLVIQFVAAGIPIAAGIGISFLTNPFNGILDISHPQLSFTMFGSERSIWILSDLFALLWIVSLMNFMNMGVKGIDGQLSGTVSIVASVIAALSLRFSADIAEWPVIILAIILSGAYFGFLPWHIFPQKIMPGFGGSTLAGYMLGVLSILSTTKVGTLLVVLAVPLIDTLYVIIRRILSGKSPFWGDRGHLHHKLLDAGLSKKQISFFYWAVTALLGMVALNLNASFKLYTILGVMVLLGGLLIWLTRMKKQ